MEQSTATALPEIDRSAEIDGFSIRLYFWSRDPRVLAGVAVVILAISVAIGQFLAAKPGESSSSPAHLLRAELASPQPNPIKVFEHLAYAEETMDSVLVNVSTGIEDLIAKSKLSESDKSVAVAFLDSRRSYENEPSADLLWYAHQLHPLAHANELIGDLYSGADSKKKAITYYEREVLNPKADSARGKLLDLYLETKDFETANRLISTPAFEKARTPERAIALATASHRWADMIQPLLNLERNLFQPAPMLLAAIAGLVWIIVALQAIQPGKIFCFRTVAPWFAIALGMASTFPTLIAGEWESEMWGLTEGKGILGDVMFYMAGVGFREEAMKLLFFLPLVPVLLARKSRLEMLMLAGFVGLGFAIEENLQYFKQFGAMAAFVRFLTANFFHLALTGMIGLSLCEAILEPRRCWIFPLTFVGLSLAHGLYDVFASVAGIPIFRMIVNLIFILVSLSFFRKLRPLRDAATDQLNIAATLVTGLAILLGYIFVCASQEAGFAAAIALLLIEFVGLCMVCYMFYWQLGEALAGHKEEIRPSYYG